MATNMASIFKMANKIQVSPAITPNGHHFDSVKTHNILSTWGASLSTLFFKMATNVAAISNMAAILKIAASKKI